MRLRGDLLPTIYQRLLQDRFNQLPPVLQQFLGEERGGRAAGRLTVTRSAGLLRNLAAAALGIPPAGEYDVVLEVIPLAAGQRWVRHFGNHTLTTDQTDYRGLLLEKSGPGSIGFELVIEAGTLFFRSRRAWGFGIPLPQFLSPKIESEDWERNSGGWNLRVSFQLPVLGHVAEYAGYVIPVEALPNQEKCGSTGGNGIN